MEKILFIGAGSGVDPGFPNEALQEARKSSIKVIDPIVIESCHGCPDLMSKYSKQMMHFIEKGDRVAAVLQGGLCFALPSIQAAQVTYPIISVPLDYAAFASAMLPSGHAVVATTSVESGGKENRLVSRSYNAVQIAANILNYEAMGVRLAGDGDLSKLEKELNELGIPIDDKAGLVLSYGPRPATIADPNLIHVWADSKEDMEYEAYIASANQRLASMPWAMQARGVKNLAVYAAKILSLQEPDLVDKIKEMAHVKRHGDSKKGGYPERNLTAEIEGGR